mmetsp:Transcript_22957/g.50366  ORF Transcript_22957/g.50366 Transcript_22957/m.50366 type:complete len:531 (+) Transcript_22957:194-1786(+)|eukprot:CAMPEP_0202892338 /NCGR_PEP_ID=MMETSP1392-20130828/2052_1 /ASSEMBLY_ACC=CAM_ASM_000868 /TAXON_ID=225041 /ORGANISM="Chlamydomonas chlamydogama, Strain SAG 11-48b" /LENGTH=530 /DNA_ID=CAMNT_0049576235 /DNA_START=172 /DNA_END=1764 /DNA_ORIENTATION=+
MNFTSIDAAMGVSQLFTQLSTPEGIEELNARIRDNVPSTATLLTWGSAAMVGYAVWEQIKFRMYRAGKKEQLPGPGFVTPILGGIVEMVKDPYGFWEKQRKYSFPGMSWHSLVGTFTVFVTDPAISRHVFNHNSADTLLMALHPSAKNVLGEHNIAFLHGPDHKALRKSFLALFTRKALGVYVKKQDEIIRNHIDQWMALKETTEMRPFVRDLNAFTSQEVFAGPYLDDPKTRAEFSEAYRNMTDAFLAPPFCLPGTAVWKGRQGRLYIIKVLTKAAARSKQRMREGHEPECLLDFWSQQVLQEMREAEEQGVPPPFYCADSKMADSVMDFLFASQDASTASLVWTLTLMAEHPDVLQKVREEQYRLRPDPDAPLSAEVLNEMVYTRQVVKEILRFRPPAPMVPQLAQQPFKLTEHYTAPKGSMIIPSVWAACMQGYENPDTFDPDRFNAERKEDVKFAQNFLVFGHGPHYCVGKEYAQNHLAAFLCRISTSLDWTRVRSGCSDEIKYLPTLYPGDSIFKFSWRGKNSKA